MSLATVTTSGPIATLTLHRADARNALSLDLLRDLHAAVDDLDARIARDRNLHVVVVTGAGKAFCAGMDLKAVLDNHDLALELLSTLAKLTIKIRKLPAVVVAKVNGAAIGGGCGLACVCDLAITHADAKLGFPEVDLGVCPAVVAPWLVRKIGSGRARKVLLSGGLMSGQQAFDIGMIDAVCASAADLDKTTDEITTRLATGGPLAQAATKKLLNELDDSLNEALVLCGAQLSADVLSTPDAQARLRAKLNA
jgi:methylglutaconyl-CoA hydratase